MEGSRVELYIDRNDGDENKSIFDTLYERKEDIEKTFGGPLEWQRLDDRRASRIYHPISAGLLQEDWAKTHADMIDAMKRLQKTLQPELNNL